MSRGHPRGVQSRPRGAALSPEPSCPAWPGGVAGTAGLFPEERQGRGYFQEPPPFLRGVAGMTPGAGLSLVLSWRITSQKETNDMGPEFKGIMVVPW